MSAVRQDERVVGQGLRLLSLLALGGAMACGAGRSRPDRITDPHEGIPADAGATDIESPPPVVPSPTPFGFVETDSGVDPPSCAASVSTAKKAAVDIIIAIDTSGSMSGETTQLKANINDFASSVGQSGLDYRVLMIAAKGTGSLQVCVPPPLGGASCADNPPLFRHFVESVSSTNSLSVILSTYTSWKAHLRLEAYKVFVVITDDNSRVTSPDFDTLLLAKDPAMFGNTDQRKYIFDSICGWKEGTPLLDPAKCSSAVNIGSVYQELSKLTGGIVDSVCKASYAGVFQNLAHGLQRGSAASSPSLAPTTVPRSTPTRLPCASPQAAVETQAHRGSSRA